jgi:hypothetical protein
VTERAVAGDPARLLATVAQARQAGWGVALDDVGAAPAGLAVLPFVRPDVIKLDMRLLQRRTTAEAAHIVNTVRAQAERTDAVVIAEGIETIKHAREAVAARSRYEFLATRAAFCGALGHGMPVAPVAGVRGAGLAPDDPLGGERALIVIGPRFAAALAAKDLGDGGPDTERRYDVAVTHDRDLVIRAAEPLLRRLVPDR